MGTGLFSFLSLALFPILSDIYNQSLSTFALIIITSLELLHEPPQMYTQPKFLASGTDHSPDKMLVPPPRYV